MQIWPAIDLRGGQCVRLFQGDYDRETVYGDDPAAVARYWVEHGADCLHLVDLDGAREGHPVNLASVEQILAAVNVPCELGGGIRDASTIEKLLGSGVSRIVIGTRALKQPGWFREMCEEHPGKLVLGVDARDGMVATDGWLETSQTPAADLVNRFAGAALAAIVYTDIARDGTLAGPNFAAMKEMKEATDFPVVASGGVGSADDVQRLAEIPMDGCIIGKALYDGKVTLGDALAAASSN